ncbi:hypothetical protein [uncultured Slackia sp.]|uniref:hypothetical protein n=1 Tax=uncultured Slackia sp. TaxID=665903 RepID=UPI002674E36C|nr:hypothetical protein [uncultured Slackia sp.]
MAFGTVIDLSIAGYEPHSGWNLPPGCYEGDPNAPWNQEEPDPCWDCAWFKGTDGDDGVCGLELEAAIANEELAGGTMADTANKAVDWALGHMRDGGRDHLRALQALAAFAVALLLAVLALEFYVIRMLAAGLVVLALLACG